MESVGLLDRLGDFTKEVLGTVGDFRLAELQQENIMSQREYDLRIAQSNENTARYLANDPSDYPIARTGENSDHTTLASVPVPQFLGGINNSLLLGAAGIAALGAFFYMRRGR